MVLGSGDPAEGMDPQSRSESAYRRPFRESDEEPDLDADELLAAEDDDLIEDDDSSRDDERVQRSAAFEERDDRFLKALAPRKPAGEAPVATGAPTASATEPDRQPEEPADEAERRSSGAKTGGDAAASTTTRDFGASDEAAAPEERHATGDERGRAVDREGGADKR